MRLLPYYNYNIYTNQFLSSVSNAKRNDIKTVVNKHLTVPLIKKVEKSQKSDTYNSIESAKK
tara:strand:+ start:807 stop:992 length:186 start_codon:yes stop_codon:yes gene_type:complete